MCCVGKLSTQRGFWPSRLGKVPVGGKRACTQLLDISEVLSLDSDGTNTGDGDGKGQLMLNTHSQLTLNMH